MTQHLYIAAATAIALTFSSASIANDPGKSKSSAKQEGAATSAANQCAELSGAKKQQCLRQAQKDSSDTGSAMGATRGSGAGTAGSAAKQPSGTTSAPK
jgi:hypothetical protein